MTVKNKVKVTLHRVKNHVVANKVAYTMTGVAIASYALMQRNMRVTNEFLIEKGINPLELTCPEAYFEQMNG